MKNATKKVGWWPNVKKGIAMLGVAGALATGGVVVQQTAVPDVASAASSWWAYTNGRCYVGSSYSTSYFYRTWYKVIDYTWYEETVLHKIDYNYPTLYYPDHADKIYGCAAA